MSDIFGSHFSDFKEHSLKSGLKESDFDVLKVKDQLPSTRKSMRENQKNKDGEFQKLEPRTVEGVGSVSPQQYARYKEKSKK